MITEKSKNQQGVSLYLGIIILSLIFAIALVVSSLFVIRMQLARDILSSVSSFYAADSALECAQFVATQKMSDLGVDATQIPCSYNSSENTQDLDHYISSACVTSGNSMVMSNGATVSTAVVCSDPSSDPSPDDRISYDIDSVRSAGVFGGTKRSAEIFFK